MVKSILNISIVLFLALSISACDNDSKAQQNGTEFTATFSGSFITASVNTDTNDDGRPASLRTYEGESNFGKITLTILDEFAQPIPPVNCPEDNLEFGLVSGSFVIRVENGDLLLGVLESGFSCFEPLASFSEIIEEGNFTGGTGEFTNVNGTIEIKTNSMFLNTTAVDGFASGGSTGSVAGMIE